MSMTRIETGLYRFDYEEKSEHGYLVNLSRKGVQHVRRFSDGVLGGKRAALHAARVWRDEVNQIYPRFSRGEVAQIKRKNNSSGVPGVFARKDAAGRVTQWVAHWLLPGSERKVSRKFAVSEYGLARAKQLAIRVREAGVRQLADDPWLRREYERDPVLTAHRRKLAEVARVERQSDWRLARVQISRLAVSLQFVCGAALKIPLTLIPTLQAANPRARAAWEMQDYEIIWPALKLTVDVRAYLALPPIKRAEKSGKA